MNMPSFIQSILTFRVRVQYSALIYSFRVPHIHTMSTLGYIVKVTGHYMGLLITRGY